MYIVRSRSHVEADILIVWQTRYEVQNAPRTPLRDNFARNLVNSRRVRHHYLVYLTKLNLRALSDPYEPVKIQDCTMIGTILAYYVL